MNQLWNVLYTNQKRKKVPNFIEGYISYNGTKVSLYADNKNYLDAKFVSNLHIEEGLRIETDAYLIDVESKKDVSIRVTETPPPVSTPTPKLVPTPAPKVSSKRKAFVVPVKDTPTRPPSPPPVKQIPTQSYQQKFQYTENNSDDDNGEYRQPSLYTQPKPKIAPTKQNITSQLQLQQKPQPKPQQQQPKPIQPTLTKEPTDDEDEDIYDMLAYSDSENANKTTSHKSKETVSSLDIYDMLGEGLDDDDNEDDRITTNSNQIENSKKLSSNTESNENEHIDEDEHSKNLFDVFGGGETSHQSYDEPSYEPQPKKSILSTPVSKEKSQSNSLDDIVIMPPSPTRSPSRSPPPSPSPTPNINMKNSQSTIIKDDDFDMDFIVDHEDENDVPPLPNNTLLNQPIVNIQSKNLPPLKLKKVQPVMMDTSTDDNFSPRSDIPLQISPKKLTLKLNSSISTPTPLKSPSFQLKRKLQGDEGNSTTTTTTSTTKSTVQPVVKRKTFTPPNKTMIKNIQESILFPDSIIVNISKQERDCEIMDKFDSLQDYRFNFVRAINEDFNIKMIDIAQKFYQGCLSLNCSAMNPMCKHGLKSQRLITKQGDNKGREYYSCAQPREKKCKYFEWVDQVKSAKGMEIDNTLSSLPQSFVIKEEKLTPESEQFFKNRGISVYFDMEFIISHKSNSNNSNSNNNPTIYLKFKKKKFTSYAKDDIWIISSSRDFSMKTTLFRSIYHAPSDQGFMEVRPIDVNNEDLKKLQKARQVYAIQGPNASSEFAMLDNLQLESLENELPILPYILNPSNPGIISENLEEAVKAERDLFAISLNYSEGLAIANRFIKDYTLNIDQKKVLLECLKWFHFKDKLEGLDDEEESFPVILVHGVFGSGKSTLLVVIILFIVELCEQGQNEDIRVFISSLTNVAVDRILLTLLEHHFNDFLRVGSIKKIAKPILMYTVHSSRGPTTGTSISTKQDEEDAIKEINHLMKTEEGLTAEDKKYYEKIIEDIRKGNMKNRSESVKTCRVVGSTCIASTFSVMDNNVFPIVFLDECSQMQEPLSLIPLSRCKNSKLLLVGDPKQLEPTIQSKPSQSLVTSGKGGLEKTLFVRLKNLKINSILLRTQYRCHPNISKISNQLFYSDELIDGISSCERPNMVPTLPPVGFCEVEDGKEIQLDGSYYNEAESNVVCRLIEIFVEKGIQLDQIGVICLYKAQAFKINEILEKKYKSRSTQNITKPQSYEDELDIDKLINGDIDLDNDENVDDFEEYDSEENAEKPKKTNKIQVSTVDAFQGAEKDIIILSCSRSSIAGGFIDNPQRINVAITRAKNHFIVVGNERVLLASPLWKTILSNSKKTRSKTILSNKQFKFN
ncbi:hypothetical protein DLAC_00477 [Tieghemostelium lacteum]|uniref:GRF-type domain-containing protein n=1 Tax=Tieghemostelium lacteum TaxID=361077 RepID=A0A152AA36_TIELA|nr:hypothetical protein DLAC_00477 [Tieghemostelium lacteum]|eukprot:KYR02991.1 hypothetical protein DLAC_00477 [Tieghemostelium lacteum]